MDFVMFLCILIMNEPVINYIGALGKISILVIEYELNKRMTSIGESSTYPGDGCPP